MNYPALIKIASVIALALLNIPGFSWAAAEPTYFYLREPLVEDSLGSCASIFDAIRAGKGEDVGGVVRSLKTINVAYLLDDYDNVLTPDRRKKNYLTYEGLQKEVAAYKRELYCRIELALYLEQDAAFAGPVYDELLREAMRELDTAYASAKSSFAKEQFERAAYAFDLIAPYRDAYEMFIAAQNRLEEDAAPGVSLAGGGTEDKENASVEAVRDSIPGPILQAFLAGHPMRDLQLSDVQGPIALAVKPGPIVAAVHVGD